MTARLNRRAIATPFFRGDETAHALWSSMLTHDVLRLAENAAVDVAAGSLARQAYWLSQRMLAKGWALDRGREIVNRLAAHFEPDRARAGTSWVPPSMPALGEQLKALIVEEAGAALPPAAPGAALAPPVQVPAVEPPALAAPVVAVVEPEAPAAPRQSAVDALAGHTRGELAQLAGAVEALRLLEQARMGPGVGMVGALKACAARDGDFGEGARWALEPHTGEVDALAQHAADVQADARNMLRVTSETCTHGYMVGSFDRSSVLLNLALGVYRFTTTHASAEAQMVALAYLVAVADGEGRVRVPVPVLSENTPLGLTAARRALRCLREAHYIIADRTGGRVPLFTITMPALIPAKDKAA